MMTATGGTPGPITKAERAGRNARWLLEGVVAADGDSG
jgi:hypothetical protein